MNVTVNEVDQHKVTLHIEVPAAEAKKAQLRLLRTSLTK